MKNVKKMLKLSVYDSSSKIMKWSQNIHFVFISNYPSITIRLFMNGEIIEKKSSLNTEYGSKSNESEKKSFSQNQIEWQKN